jgi:predicted ArsR family transcriptional regulator
MEEPPIEGSLSSLKHVMRRQLVRCLNESEDPRTPESLAGQMRQEVTPVSYHLRALTESGMATRVTRKPERGAATRFYGSAVKDNPAVQKLLDETAEADEQRLPRNPS